MSWNAFELCSGCLKHLGKVQYIASSNLTVVFPTSSAVVTSIRRQQEQSMPRKAGPMPLKRSVACCMSVMPSKNFRSP